MRQVWLMFLAAALYLTGAFFQADGGSTFSAWMSWACFVLMASTGALRWEGVRLERIHAYDDRIYERLMLCEENCGRGQHPRALELFEEAVAMIEVRDEVVKKRELPWR